MDQLSIFQLDTVDNASDTTSIFSLEPIFITKTKSYDPEKKIYNLKRDRKVIIKERHIERGLSSLIETFFKLDASKPSKKLYDYILKRIASKIIKPAIDNIQSPEEKIQKLIEMISSPEWSVTIEPVKDSYIKALCLSCINIEMTNESVLNNLPVKITVNENGKLMNVYSLLNSTINSRKHRTRRYLKDKTFSRNISYPIGDLYLTAAEIYIFKEFRLFVKKNSQILNYILVKKCINEHGEIALSNKYREDFEIVDIIENLNFTNKINYYKLPDFKTLHYDLFKCKELAFDQIYKSSLKGMSAKKNYSDFRFIYPRGLEDIWIDLLKEMLQIGEDIKAEVKREVNLSKSYASSFETKKNIPEKILKSMKNSRLNNYFGYIEFDELTDLSKLPQIEEEFINFASSIGFNKREDHAFRIRRLGKYRAGGIYFPYQKTLCIDLGSPASTVHEIMHLIDYTSGPLRLSSLYNFRNLFNAYIEIVQKKVDSLPDGDTFKEEWYGKTKYNHKYYLDPVEVFARAGEVYIKHIKNFDNSLIDATDKILYPKNKSFLDLTAYYFKKII